jgi:hypothetical protein
MRRRTHHDEIDKVLATGMWICFAVVIIILIALGLA